MRIWILAAGALFAAMTGAAVAQTLGELGAAMGAHHAAAAAGSGSASVAHQARESLTRHLPKQGGSLDEGGSGGGPMRTARAGRGGHGGSGWASGKGGGGKSGSWSGPGTTRRKKR
jgi:hypothetical protein